jgi:type II secretion system protein N
MKIHFWSLRMKGFISKRKEWLGYLLFALIFTVALLYYCFPSDAVLDYFRAMGLRANPRLALSVDRVEPSILVGLKFMKTKVALEHTPDRVILTADRLLIKPQLLSLLLGKSKFSFHCAAYQGDASGSVLFKKDPKTRFIDTEMALSNIHVGDYPYLSHLIRNAWRNHLIQWPQPHVGWLRKGKSEVVRRQGEFCAAISNLGVNRF